MTLLSKTFECRVCKGPIVFSRQHAAGHRREAHRALEGLKPFKVCHQCVSRWVPEVKMYVRREQWVRL